MEVRQDKAEFEELMVKDMKENHKYLYKYISGKKWPRESVERLNRQGGKRLFKEGMEMAEKQN